MKTEKLVISFIAIVVGIIVAGGAFYLYQTTKTIPSSKTKTVTLATPIPAQTSSIFLSIDNPKDESVVDSKTLIVSGKTEKDATLVVLTDSVDQVITPAANGNFSTTVTLNDGENHIEITAIAPDGNETKVDRTVTFSTEQF
ncbi:MAG: hypothetical protein Q8P10_00665 [bacterium]|nr:hypothetical protein [bacterium]